MLIESFLITVDIFLISPCCLFLNYNFLNTFRIVFINRDSIIIQLISCQIQEISYSIKWNLYIWLIRYYQWHWRSCMIHANSNRWQWNLSVRRIRYYEWQWFLYVWLIRYYQWQWFLYIRLIRYYQWH